jgi:hypothetical protein
MNQPSDSYGLAGTNRHEFFAPKAFGALECGVLTPLSESQLARFAVISSIRQTIPLWRCQRNLREVLDQYKAGNDIV